MAMNLASTPQLGPMEVRDNTITVPSVAPPIVPASWNLSYLTGICTYDGQGALTHNTIQGDNPNPTATAMHQTGLAFGWPFANVSGGNVFRYLDQAITNYTEDAYGSTHTITNNTFLNNVEGLTFYSFYNYNYMLADVTDNIRCNTFDNSGGYATAGIRLAPKGSFWKTGTGTNELGNPSLPNGNRFDGWIMPNIIGVVNDNTSSSLSLIYHKYSSNQEDIGANNNLFNTNTSIVTGAVAPNTVLLPTGACGNSTQPE